MKKNLIFITVICFAFLFSCQKKKSEKKSTEVYKTITPAVLKDKIAGGWAGKMIGVTYGAPVEFKALCKTFDDSIKWTTKDIIGSKWQDDIYVQLTFLETMDEFGVDAPAKKFQERFAKAGFWLWHANMQARKNYFDGIYPPQSGSPEYNMHADDIDFQIEADYLGFMCPAMPNTASKMADKIGHIMNYGDGVYGGIYVAALYCNAYFENDVAALVNKAILSIPAKSEYALILNDVIALHKKYPNNWKDAWNELETKWGTVDICGAGIPFNIDAKLNGAYITMGLLYGNGDPMKTLEISTRCGQDADCNPSNAMAVLGVMKGFSGLPKEMQEGVTAMADTLFDHTNYNFNKAVATTYKYAIQLIQQDGGKINDTEISIKEQTPIAPALEVSFPNIIYKSQSTAFDKTWKYTGTWKTFEKNHNGKTEKQSKFADRAGASVEIPFNGTGISIEGNWVKNGGLVDVYVDGKLHRTVDTYYFFANQEHVTSIWHVMGLTPGNHTVKLVVKGTKRDESKGTCIYLTKAFVFTTK